MTEAHLTSNTELAVQIGVLQEGNRNILSGIGEIKNTLLGHSEILTRHDIAIPLIDQRVTALEKAKPKRPAWYQVAAIIAGFLAAGAGITGAIVAIIVASHG